VQRLASSLADEDDGTPSWSVLGLANGPSRRCSSWAWCIAARIAAGPTGFCSRVRRTTP